MPPTLLEAERPLRPASDETGAEAPLLALARLRGRVRRRSMAGLLTALALSIGAAQLLRSSPVLLDGLILSAIAGVLGLVSLRYWTRARGTAAPASQSSPRSTRRWLPPAVGSQQTERRSCYQLAAAALILAAFAFSQVDGFHLRPAGWIAFGLSVLASLGAARYWDLSLEPAQGAGRRPAWLAWWPFGRGERRVGTMEIAILVAIILVGAALRFYRLADLPFGLWFDEAGAGLEAAAVASGRDLPIFFAANLGRTLQVYVDALLVLPLGATAFPLRLASAFVGVLGIATTFQAGRALFGARAGIAAAFLIAVSRWDNTFSRLNFDAIYIPVIASAAIFFLLRGLRTNRALDFGLAAVWTALGWYAYLPLRAFPIVIVAGILIEIVRRRAEAARLVVPLGLAALVGAAGLAPLGAVAIHQPDQFNSRVAQASVFTGRTLEAALPAVISNLQRHLLMFHREGDRNGRHNLPGAPMLDVVTGGLFILGAAYALRYCYRAGIAMLLVQFVIMLAGGVLSVEFEAPQALRSFGVLPVVMLLASIAPGAFWDLAAAGRLRPGTGILAAPGQAITRSVAPPAGAARRRLAPAWLWLVGVAIAAVPVWLNARDYFVLQANDFAAWAQHSTAETVIAHRIARLDGSKVVMASSVYLGAPTIRYLAPGAPRMVNWDEVGLPIQGAPNGALVFLQPDLGATFREIQRLYPQARFEVLRNAPNGPPALYIADVAPADMRSIEGVEVRVYAGADITEDPIRTLHADSARFDPVMAEGLATPYTIEWRAVLRAPRYGEYRFGSGQGGAQIYVDERPVGDGPVRLARGNHSFRAIQTVTSPAPVDVLWQPPGSTMHALGSGAVYQRPVTVNGLLGRYFRSNDWSGVPAIEQIDPVIAIYFHIIPLARPYTVEWTGKLIVPATGSYRLGTEAISATDLWVDGRQVLTNSQHNSYLEAAVELAAGLHDVRLRFADRDGYSHVNLFWTPPGQGREIIPSAYLLPPAEHYETVETLIERARTEAASQSVPAPAGVLIPGSGGGSTAGDTARTVTPEQERQRPSAATGPRPQPKPASPGEIEAPHREMRFVQEYRDDQLSDPRDVAVAADGSVYVLDSAGAQVLRFAPDGSLAGSFGRRGQGDGQFEEPTGIVIGPAGRISVVDAISGWIQQFDSTGGFLTKTAGPSAALYRPRGLAAGPDGRLYVPDTGGGRVVVVSAGGGVERAIGRPGNDAGELLEPVDVAVRPDGSLVVLEVGNARLQRFDASGRTAGMGPLPGSVAANGSHLTALPDGSLLVTDPDRGRLIRYSPELVPIATYGRPGDGPGELRRPIGIFSTADGSIYVADTGNRRVQRLSLVN